MSIDGVHDFISCDHIALRFIDDGEGPNDPELANRYLYGPAIDQILADEVAATNEVFWPLTDNLGSVRDIVSFDGVSGETEVVNHITYDSFGKITAESGTGPVFLPGSVLRSSDRAVYQRGSNRF